jgi:uncharacterized membrane protein
VVLPEPGSHRRGGGQACYCQRQVFLWLFMMHGLKPIRLHTFALTFLFVIQCKVLTLPEAGVLVVVYDAWIKPTRLHTFALTFLFVIQCKVLTLPEAGVLVVVYDAWIKPTRLHTFALTFLFVIQCKLLTFFASHFRLRSSLSQVVRAQ